MNKSNIALLAIMFLMHGVGCSVYMRGNDAQGEGVTVYPQSTHARKIVIVSLQGCPPCERLSADIKRGKFEGVSSGQVTVKKFYSDDPAVKTLEEKYGIRVGAFPTTLVIEDDILVGQFTGYDSMRNYWEKIKRYFNL